MKHKGLFDCPVAKTPRSQCRGLRFDHCSGLISFKIDWFELLAVQGILKSLLQHRSLKALILPVSACLMVQLSHLYMTAGKTS